MFEHFFEWLASRRDERFECYRGARLRYEAYVNRHRVVFHQLQPDDYRRARADPDLQAAEGMYRRALALSREKGAAVDVATALYQLGMLLHLQGRFAEAEGPLKEALETLKSLPHPDETIASGCHYHLGFSALRLGRIGEARWRLRKSMEIDEALGDLPGIRLNQAALDACDQAAPAGGPEEAHGDLEETTPRPGEAPRPGVPAETVAGLPGPCPEPVAPTASHGPEADAATAAAEEEGTSVRIDYSGNEDVVWLLSHSVRRNDEFLGALEKLTGSTPRPLTVCRAAFGSERPEHRELPPLAPHQQLRAAVVVLERDGLEDEQLSYWLRWCIQTVAARDDFRLFVCLADDLTQAEFDARAGARQRQPPGGPDEVLHTLLDTVQFTKPSPEEVCRLVRRHLRRADGLRDAARWREMRSGLAMLFGRAAGAAQVVAGLAVAFGLIAVFLMSGGGAGRLAIEHPEAIGLLAGIVVFPLCTPFFFFWSRGVPAAGVQVREGVRAGRIVSLAGLSLAAAIVLAVRVGAPALWIALGLTVGLLLDHARREAHQARRTCLSVQRALESSGDRQVAAALGEAAWKQRPDPLRCPLLPSIANKVFISYTRSSDWSRKTALELHRKVAAAGIDSFIDTQDIGEGSSWRSVLNRRLSDATVFIAVIDESSVTREWVAAEWIHALVGHVASSRPEFIVLTKPGLAAPRRLPALPIFAAVLDGAEGPPREGQPRIIEAGPSTLDVLVSGLSPHRCQTPAIFPSSVGVLLAFLAVPVVALGTIGPLIGVPSVLFSYLEYWGKFSLSEHLASWHLLSAAYLLCGFWLGFVGCLAAISRYEAEHESPAALAWTHLLATVGFAGLLGLWARAMSPLTIGWAAALAGIGWILAAGFFSRVAQQRPDLRRRT